MAQANELEYLAKHPGGFDREFFEQHLVPMIEDWQQRANAGEYLVEIETRDGHRIALANARFALTWGAFLTEAGAMELIPYSEIARVVLRPRPVETPKRQVGFTAEPVATARKL